MRFRDILLETVHTTISAPELDGMKDLISRRIKELPDDENTAKALKQIEDLLKHVGVGGRYGLIGKEVDSIQDRSVRDAKKVLARLVLSIIEEKDATPEQQEEFFSIWKDDTLVNKEVLLSNEQVDFAAVFNGYGQNPIITEFVDEVMAIQELGMGRGEFGLSVLSKDITVAGKKSKEDNDEDSGSKKGDLQIKFSGGTYQVELKTEMGGAARFGDQEVRPAEGFEAAAITLNKFVKTHGMYNNLSSKISGSGLNLNQAIEFHQLLQDVDRNKFLNLVRKCISLIFGNAKDGREDYAVLLKKNINAIMDAIETGQNGEAAQQWSQASFNYYMSKKHDDGVLYLNLNTNTFVFYKYAEQLLAQGLRFHASTPYITATKDPVRAVYPKISIQASTFGGDAAKSGLKQITKGKNPLADPDFSNRLVNWALTLSSRRGVTDQGVIGQIIEHTMKLIQSRMPTHQIILELENKFPQLKLKLPAKKPAAPAATAAPAPTAAPVQQPIEPVQQEPTQPNQRLGHLRQGSEEESEPNETPQYGYPQKYPKKITEELFSILKNAGIR
jgi:hypothetical protein